MAKAALKSDQSGLAEDLFTDDQAGRHSGETPVEPGQDPGPVVRPFLKRETRRVRDLDTPKERPINFLKNDLLKSRSDEKVILRPIFPKSPVTSEVVQYFLEPPKSIAVVEGVRPHVEG
ncbi:MAG TPA: hypothetical protein PKV86_15990, partial [Syntrophobacteraceae bacterium]|nr:hypothetical protein [Syntrophobacteraceae bacterium]